MLSHCECNEEKILETRPGRRAARDEPAVSRRNENRCAGGGCRGARSVALRKGIDSVCAATVHISPSVAVAVFHPASCLAPGACIERLAASRVQADATHAVDAKQVCCRIRTGNTKPCSPGSATTPVTGGTRVTVSMPPGAPTSIVLVASRVVAFSQREDASIKAITFAGQRAVTIRRDRQDKRPELFVTHVCIYSG